MWYTLSMDPRLGKILLSAGIVAVLLFLFGLRDPFLPRVFSSAAKGERELATLDLATAASDSVALFGRRLLEMEEENIQLHEELGQLDRTSRELQRRLDELASLPRLRPLQDYPFPDSVSFCGEAVSLENPVARDRFESEFNRFLVNRHWLISWMRRSRDVFPWVERRLAQEKMPDDLKYVAVIESALDPRATSPVGAAGLWQFTRDTGRRYGLHRTRSVDERRDPHEATDAALQYMQELHEEFGSWALVLAAYNSGERRIRDAIEDQGQTDFHELYLPRETEAYWYKAAAAKLFFEHPSDYDLTPPPDGWTPVVCDTLLLSLSREKPIRDVLGDSGLSYKRFKQYNPSYRQPRLPAGKHRLVLPRPYAERIAARYPHSSSINVAQTTLPSQ